MTNTTKDREKALAWWDQINNIDIKAFLVQKYLLRTNCKLTVSEIVQIWTAEEGEKDNYTSGNPILRDTWEQTSVEREKEPTDNPEVIKWFNAYKDCNQQFIQMAKVAAYLKATNDDLVKALQGIVDNWDSNPAGTREELKTSEVNGEKYTYWTPAGMIVSSEFIAKAREVLIKASTK